MNVAVIGAGPGGLVAARWLLSQGFEPTIFEQAPMLGGQWTGLDGCERRVADHAHQHQSNPDCLQRPRTRRRPRVPVEPRHPRLPQPLCRHVRPSIAYSVRHAGRAPRPGRRRLARRPFRRRRAFRPGRGRERQVPVPRHPRLFPGLDTFTGPRERSPPTDYRGPSPYRGKRVLVAGGAISALEIAAELAQLGAARVVVTQRRQRYVLPKFAAGVPSDHRIFTRYGTLATETLPPAEIDRQLKEIVVEAGGSPEQYGAPAPDPSLFAAGRHAQPAVPAAGRGGPNHGAAVDGVHRGHDRDVRRRARRGVRRNRVRHGVRAQPAVPERGHSGDPRPRRRPPRRRPVHLPPRPSRAGLHGHVGPVGRILRAT